MSLFSILVGLIVVGVFLWLVNHFIPMDRKIKSILNVVVVILVVLWLLNAFGFFRLQHPDWLIDNQFSPAGTECSRSRCGNRPISISLHLRKQPC